MSGDNGSIIRRDDFFGCCPARRGDQLLYQFSASVCSLAGSAGITGNKDGNTNIVHISSLARPGMPCTRHMKRLMPGVSTSEHPGAAVINSWIDQIEEGGEGHLELLPFCIRPRLTVLGQSLKHPENGRMNPILANDDVFV